jgi:hypothetical protein
MKTLFWLVMTPILVVGAWLFWLLLQAAIPMPWRWLLLPLAVATGVWHARWAKANRGSAPLA